MQNSKHVANNALFTCVNNDQIETRGIGRTHGIIPFEAVYQAFGATEGQRTG